MDFLLNEKQKMIRKITREFVEEYVAPVAEESDQNSQLDPKVMEEMMERDFFIFPKEAKEMGFIDGFVGPVKAEPSPAPQTTFPDGFCEKPGRSHISVCDP